MKPPPKKRAEADFRAITDARLTLGLRTAALSTKETLRFSLDHAQARAAVMSTLDIPRIEVALTEAGLPYKEVTSTAETRDTFIRRPDLGRRISQADADTLTKFGPCDVALVLGDGLSATAANLSGSAFMIALAARLTAKHLSLGPVVMAHQARVALGDPVAMALGAKTVVVALGERPGLSAADSLGVYITHAPYAGIADSQRNCLSNIRDGGLDIPNAVAQTEKLILAMRQLGKSGVSLSQSLASGVLPGADAGV